MGVGPSEGTRGRRGREAVCLACPRVSGSGPCICPRLPSWGACFCCSGCGGGGGSLPRGPIDAPTWRYNASPQLRIDVFCCDLPEQRRETPGPAPGPRLHPPSRGLPPLAHGLLTQRREDGRWLTRRPTREETRFSNNRGWTSQRRHRGPPKPPDRGGQRSRQSVGGASPGLSGEPSPF